MQQLPQAPFALDRRASFAENFTLDAGPPLNIDIPVDPAGSELFLQKTASRSQAASGDFVRYTLDLVNNSAQGSAAKLSTHRCIARWLALPARVNATQ